MGKTNIGWTNDTWNPVTGCTKVSPGCKNCYAEELFERWGKSWGPFTDVRSHPERLDQPLHWKKPRRVFVNSMSDLFHENVPTSFLEQVFSVMWEARRHIFQVLTKRPQRMFNFLHYRADDIPSANVWLGVSVENQKYADERIPLLLRTPAAVRFLSVEPLLEPVKLNLMGIDWVIVGGESGKHRRSCETAWIVDVVRQCRNKNIPCFVKQDSALAPGKQGRLTDDVWTIKEFPPH